ncbi:MAG: type I DNA topoisomerase [Gemmatirosa sp.]
MATKKAATKKTTAKRATAAGGARTTRARAAASDPAEHEEPTPPGTTSLVIVESPAKAKTIAKYLGRGYKVRATVGHIMDLPEKKLGVDVDHGFDVQLEPIAGKEKTIAELKSAAKDAKEIFVATDPDREGEAIAAHVADLITPKRGPKPIIRRVLFHEITKEGIARAMAQPGEIDTGKVDAQQARRVLDRLVGYKASPVLWKTVKKGLSAGRVQTVALRLIVEREREIRAFLPVEYWSITAQLEKGPQAFTAKLHHVDGKKPEISNAAQAEAILADVQGREIFPVTDVKRRERRKNPQAPFTTSTLQQEGAKKLGFGSKRTMRLAQDLYEGIDVGPEGAVGLITYMRTDSTRVAESAATAARDHLRTLFGEDYLAPGLQLYGSTKQTNSQDAHEGIRPTDPTRRPELVRKYLSADQLKLYELVWKRFMASQMAPAVFDTTTVDFELRPQGDAGAYASGVQSYAFRATGSVVKFQGFLTLYREAREEGDSVALEDEQALPALEQGEQVPVRDIVPQQHFTQPPPRFSEASLVKELERLGIGRPSTYASIISVLADRRYVLLEQRRFFPTALGETVERVMVKKFPAIFDVQFTSTMEGELDRVEGGGLDWRTALQEFWGPFSEELHDRDLDTLIAEAHDLSALETERCKECGGKLVPKAGFFGPFVACEHHPKNCKYTRPISGERKPPVVTEYLCPECGEPMYLRQGKSGDFLGCSKFPKCRGTRALPTGVKCPKDGGDISQRKSKARGKIFYGCENYPSCDFVVWDKPVKDVCPECGYEGAEAKQNKTRGAYRKCLKCQNEWDVAEPVEPVEQVAEEPVAV